MKIQNKLNMAKLLVMALMVLIVSNAYSQRPNEKDPPRIPDSTQIVKMTNELSKELSLTIIQKEKITNLYFNHFKEVQKQLDENKSEEKEKREEMEVLRIEFENQIKGLLNEDQIEKFINFQQTHKPDQKQEQQKKH